MKATKKWSKIMLAGMFSKAMVIAVLALGLVLVGCDDGNDGGGGGSGDPITSALYGTYRVTSPSAAVGHTINVGDGTWSMYGHTVNSHGSYTLSSDQRTATLYAYDITPTVGTVFITGTELTGILNNASGHAGTYTATKTAY